MSYRTRLMIAAPLALGAALALHLAPDFAWGGVTLHGQRYKMNASHIYAIVPPGAAPPRFTGCTWAGDAPDRECSIDSNQMLGVLARVPTLVTLGKLLSVLSAVVILAGMLLPALRRIASAFVGVALLIALVATVIPFATVTHAVPALRDGTLFVGARGSDCMLIGILALGTAWCLLRQVRISLKATTVPRSAPAATNSPPSSDFQMSDRGRR